MVDIKKEGGKKSEREFEESNITETVKGLTLKRKQIKQYLNPNTRYELLLLLIYHHLIYFERKKYYIS